MATSVSVVASAARTSRSGSARDSCAPSQMPGIEPTSSASSKFQSTVPSHT